MNKSKESKIVKTAKDILSDAMCKDCKHFGKWQVDKFFDSSKSKKYKLIVDVCKLKLDIDKKDKFGEYNYPNDESATMEENYCENFEKDIQ